MSKLFVDPVIGYRAWYISTGTYGLCSPVVKQEWKDDGPTTATCHPLPVKYYEHTEEINPTHASPANGCRCGLYAWHQARYTDSYLDNGDHAVIGASLAWGKYRVATKGFRSQYMQPLALVDPRPERTVLGWSALLEKVSERYQIPLLQWDMLQDYAETHGSPMGIEFTQ